MAKITGGCQCGAVRYEIDAEPMVALHCECLDCKKSSGSGHITAGAFPEAAVHLTGTLKTYSSPTDSGAVATRGFCPECGGRVSFRSSGIPGMLAITAGSMDDPGAISPSIAVYHKRHVSWDHLDPALPMPRRQGRRLDTGSFVDNSGIMETSEAIAAFSAVAQHTRLDVFRLLVRHEPGGLASGDIARALDVPRNTMSSHLAILQQAGLVEGIRKGRSVIYRARLAAVREIVRFLLQDCCNGQPALCAPILEDLAANPAVKSRCCC